MDRVASMAGAQVDRGHSGKKSCNAGPCRQSLIQRSWHEPGERLRYSLPHPPAMTAMGDDARATVSKEFSGDPDAQSTVENAERLNPSQRFTHTLASKSVRYAVWPSRQL